MNAQEICDVALLVFKRANRAEHRTGPRRQQWNVNFREQGNLLSLKKEVLIERCLRPAMANLASRVPHDVIFLHLELPEDVHIAATSEFLRLCGDTQFQPTQFNEITGEPIEYGEMTIVRFDVLFELA